MSTPYTVKSGDWLQKIAEEHGFESWRDLYYHPDNAAFRAKRPDPDKIYPGDVIMIPDRGTPPPGGGPPPPPVIGPDRQVVARRNDSLCSIAVAHGFPDCAKLRRHPANAEFLNRPLEEGDVVTVPGLTEEVQDGATEQRHEFQLEPKSEAEIRFVHGSPDLDFEDDPTLDVLRVSNYVTTQAGADGQQAFVDENHRQFDADAHADPDTFKVEVHDRFETGNDIEVRLEAIRPTYASPTSRQVTGHVRFPAGAERDARSIDPAGASRQSSTQRFRTGYMRLAVDEDDAAARPNQALLVTDMTDGAGGGAGDPQVEILDQEVRATYDLPRCPAAPGQHRCQAMAQLPVSHDADQLRIRMAIHIFRSAPGAAGGVAGITEANVRRRTTRWFRRVYAQAEMAPRLVDPEVQFIDPPADDMLTISQDTGQTASSVNAAGNVSRITFTLSQPPPAGPSAGDPNVVVNLPAPAAPAGPLTPRQVGDLIVAALPAGFSGFVFENPRNFNAALGSCDVIIARDDGQRLMILNAGTDDTGLGAAGVAVARVNVNAVNINAAAGSFPCLALEHRRVTRSGRVVGGNWQFDAADDRLDTYVVGGLVNPARGRATTPGFDLPAPFQRAFPLRLAALMSVGSGAGPTHTMDGGDVDPFSYPHEAGHILHDGFHTATGAAGANTELMRGGTSPNNAVGATKRICDDPVRVSYGTFNPSPAVQAATPGASTNQQVSATQRVRTRAAQVLEAW